MQEARKPPEKYLEEAKKLIGRQTKPIRFPYPIEHEPIRRYCLMIDDDNPLFLDPEYAEKTTSQKAVFPPFAVFGIMSNGSPKMMRDLATGTGEDGVMPPTPGSYLINMAQEWEWFKPVVVGDWLTMKSRLGDVYIKPIRLDPKAFWIVTEFHYSNQNEEKVCIVRNIHLSHRSPEEVAADSE